MMRITALRPLVRGLHTSRTACNAASTSTSSAEPISTGSADASNAADAVQVTESGRRDIESARFDQSGKKSSSKQRSSKAPAPEISLDILTEDISMLLPEGTAAPAPSSAGSRRSRSTPHSSGERAQGGPSGERSSRPRDRSDRHAQGDRGRERDQQSQQYQGQRRPRAGAVQRAAARSSPRAASGSSSSFGDLEMQDNRPRGKQAVEPIEFDTSFKALFGRSNLVGAASASASRLSKKGQSAETSDWAVQRGMKADQARREEILRAAGAYLSETPTAAFPSTLPAKTPAPQRARAVAQWTMAMNPSINIAAQRQAGKVFDAFLK